MEQQGDSLNSFEKIALSSLHTTAGMLEQSFATKLGNTSEGIHNLVRSARRLFPEGAPYWHDQMEFRDELSLEQRKYEPLNADSHLAFICLGLCNSVLYNYDPKDPIFFIDLDGEFQGTYRSRKLLAIGYHDVSCVHERFIPVEMPKQDRCALDLSGHLLDFQTVIDQNKIHRGVLTFELDTQEKHAGVTVNEFENLLMERDITDVLKNPLKYMLGNVSEFAKHPLSLPNKAKKVMMYELHQAIRDGLRLASRGVSAVEHIAERLGMQLPLLEHAVDLIATPLENRWMNLGNSMRFLINAEDNEETGRIVTGTYQSPILIQWRRAESDIRHLKVRLLKFS
ncbi:MAG: hypothetical protein OXF06_00360 [Bacteroidetes bacterium]|nr:hypothetical protein [Bacteroidota bacterium]